MKRGLSYALLYILILAFVLNLVSLSAQAQQALPLLGDKALNMMVDGHVALEYSPWNVEGTVSFRGNDKPPVLELNSSSKIKAIILQADWNDSYLIDCSLDGQAWRPLWTAVPVGGIEGLATRGVVLEGDALCHYLRVRGGAGDGVYSIAEIQVFSEVPEDWDSRMNPPRVDREWWPWIPFFDAQRVERLRLLLCIFAIAVVAWLAAVRIYQPEKDLRWPRYFLGCLAVLSYCAWSNLFQFHYDSPIHRHEFFHYYLGSKYSNELSYTRLYRCAALADIEDGFLKEDRLIRDLTNNKIESTAVVRATPNLCRASFAEGVWSAFKSDLAWFRSHMDAASYQKAMLDHGFNGTPVWAIFGTLFSAASPASSAQLYSLGLIDLILMSGAFVFCFFTFGFVPSCIAIIFWGTNFFASFSWTGNGFIRADWLAAFLVGVCFLKRRCFFWGGAFLMFSALSRLFPAAFLFGAVVTSLIKMCRSRKSLRQSEAYSLVLGAIVSAAALVTLATLVAGRFSIWEDFVANTRKHAFNYSTNIIGAPAVLSTSVETWSHDLEDSSFPNPLEPWVDAKKKIFAERKIMYFGYILLVLVMMATVFRRCEIWEGAILAGVFVTFVNLSNYDYYFLLPYAFLFFAAPKIPLSLLLLCASSWILAEAFSYFDQVYFVIGVAVHAFFFFAMREMIQRKDCGVIES